MVSPAAYTEPPLPVVLEDEPVPVLESSPFQEVAGSPVRECSPSFQASPVGSGYGPITTPVIAVVTDSRCSWAAAPYGHDGPVLATDGCPIWGGGLSFSA